MLFLTGLAWWTNFHWRTNFISKSFLLISCNKEYYTLKILPHSISSVSTTLIFETNQFSKLGNSNYLNTTMLDLAKCAFILLCMQYRHMSGTYETMHILAQSVYELQVCHQWKSLLFGPQIKKLCWSQCSHIAWDLCGRRNRNIPTQPQTKCCVSLVHK